MFTSVYLWLLLFIYVFFCLPSFFWFTPVYLCLFTLPNCLPLLQSLVFFLLGVGNQGGGDSLLIQSIEPVGCVALAPNNSAEGCTAATKSQL